MVGAAEAAGRDFGSFAAASAPRASRCVGQPLGGEAAGGDRVDGDPVGGDLARERLEEADRGHPVRVGEVEAGDRLAGRAGADVDDPAPAALAHARQTAPARTRGARTSER